MDSIGDSGRRGSGALGGSVLNSKPLTCCALHTPPTYLQPPYTSSLSPTSFLFCLLYQLSPLLFHTISLSLYILLYKTKIFGQVFWRRPSLPQSHLAFPNTISRPVDLTPNFLGACLPDRISISFGKEGKEEERKRRRWRRSSGSASSELTPLLQL